MLIPLTAGHERAMRKKSDHPSCSMFGHNGSALVQWGTGRLSCYCCAACLPGRCCLLLIRSRALTGMIHLVHSMVAGGALARVPEAAAAAAGGFLEQLLAAMGCGRRIGRMGRCMHTGSSRWAASHLAGNLQAGGLRKRSKPPAWYDIAATAITVNCYLTCGW